MSSSVAVHEGTFVFVKLEVNTKSGEYKSGWVEALYVRAQGKQHVLAIPGEAATWAESTSYTVASVQADLETVVGLVLVDAGKAQLTLPGQCKAMFTFGESSPLASALVSMCEENRAVADAGISGASEFESAGSETKARRHPPPPPVPLSAPTSVPVQRNSALLDQIRQEFGNDVATMVASSAQRPAPSPAPPPPSGQPSEAAKLLMQMRKKTAKGEWDDSSSDESLEGGVDVQNLAQRMQEALSGTMPRKSVAQGSGLQALTSAPALHSIATPTTNPFAAMASGLGQQSAPATLVGAPLVPGGSLLQGGPAAGQSGLLGAAQQPVPRAQTSDDVMEQLMQKMLEGGVPPDHMQQFIQILMLKELMGARKQKKRSSGSGSSSDDDVVEGGKDTALVGAMKNMQKLRKKRVKAPLSITRRFRRSVMKKLNVHPGEVWSYKKFWETLPVGRHKSIGRIMYVLAECIELHETGLPDIAYATEVQLFKALHQLLLDKGSWAIAWHLTLLEKDPYAQETFGGEDDELCVIGGHMKAGTDLWDKVHKNPKAGQDESGDPEAQEGKGKGKKDRKNKKKDGE